MDILEFYKTQGKRTKISKGLSRQFGQSLDDIMQGVRNFLTHPCERHSRRQNVPSNIGFQTIGALEKELKKPDATIGICRDFSLLTTALLRDRGIPARCRCGFANYFAADWEEDHWVVEYYDEKEKKWKLIDSQKMKHVTVGEYINGAIAWELYRQYKFNPRMFGFHALHDKGRHYIIGNLMRDFFSLLKDERKYSQEEIIMETNHYVKKEEFDLLDEIAVKILDDDIKGLQKIKRKYF